MLTPDGEFIKINKEHKNYNLGEEISIKDDAADLKPGMNGGWKRKALLSVLAATLLVVASFTPNLFSESKVSAYISMDVHSSIELGITEDLEVIELKGINQEGKHIVNNLNEWQGQDLEVVIDEVLALNHSAGYNDSNQNILFSTVIVNKDHEELEESLVKKLKDVEDIPRIQDSMKVEMKKATVDDRREASDKGISTGIYLEQTNKKPNTHSSIEKVEKTTSVNSTKKQSSSTGENGQPGTSTKQKTIHNQNQVSKDYKSNDEKTSKSREKTLVNEQQQKVSEPSVKNSKPDTVHINKDKENSMNKVVNKKIPKDSKNQKENKTVSKTGTDKKTGNNKIEQRTKPNQQLKDDSGRNVKGKEKNNQGLHKQKNKPPVQQKHMQDLHKQKQKEDPPNKHNKGPEHKYNDKHNHNKHNHNKHNHNKHNH